MKSINVDVFTFDELSDEVKAKLVEENRYEFQGDAVYMDWKDMWAPTIKKFQEIFNVSIKISDRYGWRCDVNFNEEYYFDNGEFDGDADNNNQYSIRLEDMSGKMLRNYLDKLFSECMKGKYYSVYKPRINENGETHYGNVARRSKITKTWNDCPLTGCCSDISILEPIAEYLNHKQGDYGWKKADGTINKSWKYYTFKDLIEACADSIIKAIEESEDYYESDEYVLEELSNRSYGKHFLADGKELNV